MNKVLLILLLNLGFTLFAEPLVYNDLYGIEESKKGYFDIFVLDENGDHVYLLDSGRYLNSRIFIKDGDKRFFLRERGEYVVNISENTFQIKWRVDSLEVIEDFYLVKDGFRYVITIKNRTEVSRNVGLYIMYDTVLGEESKNHFLIDDYKIINRERIYRNTEIPQSIKSENERRQGVDFRFMENENIPDSIILGNWDRLAFSKKWPYIPKEGGHFSYGYYSINDSGIGVVFNGVNLNPDDKIVYSYSILPYFTREVEVAEPVVKEKKKKWFFDTSDDEVEPEVTEDPTVTEESEVIEEPEVTEEPEIIEDKTEKPVVPEGVVDTAADMDTSESIPDSVEPSEPTSVDNIPTPEETTADDVDTPVTSAAEIPDNVYIPGEIEEIPEEPAPTLEDDTDVEKDELLLMLEYIQKKKRGEDVSEYDFTEEDILKRLNNNNE